MNRVNICDLLPKQSIESTFLVKHIAVMEAKDGKKYLNVILSDSTGDLESRAWNDAEKIASLIPKGSFAEVSGKVNMFQGRKQFIISSINAVDQSLVNMDDFVVKASSSPEKMFSELMQIVENLDDVYIKDLLTSILNDPEINRRLKLWQAGKSIHHAYQSGLLEHVLSCASLAVSLSSHYKVNTNYVVAGAILHDLCKIYELTDGFNVEYTEEGKLVGHLVKALEIVDRFTYRIKNFPYQTKMHLKHILLSHHGHYEYGSPKIPQTSEAMLVHMIDLMDSKMHTFETIKRTDNNVGHWSGYVKHLDRIVFKGELPHFTDYQQESSSHKQAPKEKKAKQPQIKQNLGSLLKDFKVED